MTEGALAAGVVLGGKYRIVRVLGEGGMAVVLEAVHVRLGQRVAIKVLREELTTDAGLVARFDREGRALSTLRSRNVVRVFDVDATPSGAPFLVMEYLEGVDLEGELGRRGPLPVGEAVAYLLQACAAMQEAHANGIVHRDLKPTNIFLANEGSARVVKVLDFGIATDGLPTGDARLTRTESVMGTPLYMAPEQFRATRDVDARADVWALGATLYELLTGEPPFTGTASTIGVSIVTEDPRPIATLRAGVPPGLCQVVVGALAKDRERRIPSMLALADALAPFSDGVVLSPRAAARAVEGTSDVASANTLPLVPAQVLEGLAPPPIAAATTQDARRAVPGRRVRSAWWALVAVPVIGASVLVVSRPSSRVSAPASTQAPGSAPLPVPAPASIPPASSQDPTATILPEPTIPPLSTSATTLSTRADAGNPALQSAPRSKVPPTPHAKRPAEPGAPPLFFPR